MEPCPVCDDLFPVHELPEHVQLHFLEDAPAAAGGTRDAEEDAADHTKVRCPLGCGALVLLEELDSHEEAHRLLELEAQDRSMAQQQEQAEFEKLQQKYGFSDKVPQRSGKCFKCGQQGHWSRECPNNPAAQAERARKPLTTNPLELARVQQPDPISRLDSGVDIMAMLQTCFQGQQKPRTTVYLSGPVSFCCRGPADSGWGCGYRNIQMQVSHLLLTSPEHRAALFGGAGFIPDLPALQAWLEVAWQAGFDPGGAAMLQAVQCTRKWIGTTEAAALLRYFGCRALIVDFYGKSDLHTQGGQGGPTIHQGVACDLCGAAPIIGVRHKSYSTPDFDCCSGCSRLPEARPHAPFFETGSAGRDSSSSGGDGGRSSEGGGSDGQLHAAAAAAAAGGGGGDGRGKGRGGRGAGGGGGGRGGNNKRKQPESAADRHQALAEWVWAYFSTPGFQGADDGASQQQQQQSGAKQQGTAAAAAASSQGREAGGGGAGSSNGNHPGAPAPRPAVNAFTRLQQRPTAVVMSGKPPLYFQHEGHSRTIVGIERTVTAGPPSPNKQQNAAGGVRAAAAGVEYSLVVLDPGMPTAEVVSSLRTRDKWQMKVKRGMHSLARHSELQLLYVAPGVVPEGPERDGLKRVIAAERYKG